MSNKIKHIGSMPYHIDVYKNTVKFNNKLWKYLKKRNELDLYECEISVIVENDVKFDSIGTYTLCSTKRHIEYYIVCKENIESNGTLLRWIYRQYPNAEVFDKLIKIKIT